MSDTIRDVKVNVSIETSISSASDGLKQLQQSATNANEELTRLSTLLSTIQTQQSSMPVGQLEADRSAAQSQQNLPGGSTVLSPNAGSANSISGVSSSVAQSITSTQEGKQGQLDLRKNEQQPKKEQNPSTKYPSSSHEAYANSLKNAAVGAGEFAKGLVAIAAAGDEADAAMLKGIQQAQEYFNVLRSGADTVKNLGAAIQARSAGPAGLSAGNVAGGAASAGGTAGRAAGSLGTLASPLGLLAAAAVGTAVAIRQLGVWTRDLEKQQKADNTHLKTVQSDAANAAVGRHVSQSMRMIQELPDNGSMRQDAINIEKRGAIESQIQKEQAGSDRDFGAKQEIRSRHERAGAIEEQKASAANAMAHADKQQGVLEGAKSKFAEDKAASLKAHQSKVAAIKKEFRAVPDPQTDAAPKSAFGPGKRGWKEFALTAVAAPAVLGYGYATGNLKKVSDVFGKGSLLTHAITGEETTSQVQQHNAKKALELQHEEGAGRASQVNAEAERGVELARQELALGKQKAEAATAYLTALRQQAAASRQNYEADKQTVDAGHQNLGGMSKGMQIRAQQIEAKRKAGKELTHYELQIASKMHGTVMADYARKQMQKQGESLGIEMAPDVKGSKAKADADQKELDEKEPALLGAIKEQASKNESAGESLINAIKEADKTEELFARLQEVFESQARAMEQNIAHLKQWIR